MNETGNPMPVSVPSFLKKNPVRSSAPCRVDSGGTWDIKTLALPLQGVCPATVNFALDLRTEVTLLPYREGWVSVRSEGFERAEEHPCDAVVFDSPFGIFFAAVSHFGFDGIQVRIRSGSPVKSALGGSSTALVALVKGLSKLAASRGENALRTADVLHLAYQIEDAVSRGKCGIQDQAAAAYGGVHLWEWHYGRQGSIYTRTPLAGRKDAGDFSERILVAFSGRSHVSSRVNRSWVAAFLSGETRAGWIEANEIVRRLAEALKRRDWDGSARLLREEMVVRRAITPDALIPLTARLIELAEKAGCGARFAGAGCGGSVWALGDKERIRRLQPIWADHLKRFKGAQLLDCRIDPSGVI